VQSALAGDPKALELVASRMVPAAKPENERDISIPGLAEATSVEERSALILNALGQGHLSIEEFRQALGALADLARALHASELSRSASKRTDRLSARCRTVSYQPGAYDPLDGLAKAVLTVELEPWQNPALGNTVLKSLQTPSSTPADAVVAVSGALNALLADTFALYVKHRHVSGPQGRRWHDSLDRPHRQAAAREKQR
jgi:hypothetical protein